MREEGRVSEMEKPPPQLRLSSPYGATSGKVFLPSYPVPPSAAAAGHTWALAT